MVEKAALLVCPLDVTESHWSPAWSLRLGQEAPPFVSAVSLPLEPGNVSSHSCRPAVGVLPGPQGFSGLLVLGLWGQSLQLEAEKPTAPSAGGHSISPHSPMVLSAERQTGDRSGGRATLGSPSSFKEKRERLDGRENNMDLLGLNYCMSHLGRYCRPHYTKETDCGR